MSHPLRVLRDCLPLVVMLIEADFAVDQDTVEKLADLRLDIETTIAELQRQETH